MATHKRDNNREGHLFGRFIPYIKPYAGILALDLFCASLTSVCEIVLPLIMRSLTDLGLSDVGSLSVALVLRMGLLYLVLRLIDVVAYYYQTNQGHVMGAKIEADLRRDLFSHLQTLPNAYYDNAKVGNLMSTITTDLNDITEFAHHFPEELFVAVLKIGVSFGILAATNLPLTLVVYAMIPLMAFAASRFNGRMREAFHDSRVQLGELNSQVEDSLLGVRVVKAFSGEPIEREKFAVGNHNFLAIKGEMYKWMAAFHATTRLFDGLMYLLVLVMGGLWMMWGQIGAGDMVAYMLYVTMLIGSVRRIVEFTEQFQRGMSSLRRFFGIMDTKSDIVDAPDAVGVDKVVGDLTFDHVSFQYEGTSGLVLSDINLHIPAGQSVALVGPSGGGKTTLCNLIPRFYEVSKGRLLLDGRDIRDIKILSLRKNIGMVQQDVYLFSGSIRDNIAYGKPDVSDGEVIEAAKSAGAHEFIVQMPHGYDTHVGERGVKLSGGQKQRISIARVFLKDPPVLILDEATSALDNESELLVQQSLEKLMKGRTTFTIAHRLTTIRNADCILVLTENGIEEQGTRDELLAKDGLYKSLEQAYGTLERA